MMTGNEIRQRFLDFFAGQGHTIVESSALVPEDDPTLLFTNAGMVQFKRVFMGEDKRDYVRAATAQRCVRAGGKHNDLENVGYTARHHTFFEMLGNFSFGDYFKREAITMAWTFLTKELGLPPEKLWVSVFEDDDEAYGLWEEIPDLPEGRIIRLGEKDNFWAMGDTGPCGPCSEILIDQGPGIGCGTPECKAGCDCDRYLELWNLVFMQYYRDADGTLTPLPKPSIDTGMGLERIAAVVQGVNSNYDSDLFAPILARIADKAGVVYGDDAHRDTAMRVIADHSRAAAFLVADGVLPANEGRGYVLRRVMRRAIRYGRTLGLNEPFMAGITQAVVESFSDAYPHLREAVGLMDKVVQHEEMRFFETIDHGLAMLEEEMARLAAGGEKMIAGPFIFKLYDTFGFPVDIVRDIALERGFSFDEAGYHKAMAAQREQSRQSWKAGGLEGLSDGVRELAAANRQTVFTGYRTRQGQSVISDLLGEDGRALTQAGCGERVIVVCPETPFYAEAGGQVGDTGSIIGRRGKARVIDTVKLGGGLILHKAEVAAGQLDLGEEVELMVEEDRRRQIAANHTATHLLQAALRQVLGDHVRQSGSLVDDRRLRFDFTHFSPMSRQEIAAVEQWINDAVRANITMQTQELAREEAQKSGATALFGEKYGETVRVVTVGSLSKELCGGTHVGATGEIGLCKIMLETGIAAGVRRLEAVTGAVAVREVQRQEACLLALADRLKTVPNGLADRLDKLLERQRHLEREVGRLTAQLSAGDLNSAIDNAREIHGVRIITAKVPLDSPKTLRQVGDGVRDRMGRAVAVLGGEFAGKAALLVLVAKELTDTLKAGAIVSELAAIVGGRGGGRPDMAQAGGPRADKLEAAIAAADEVIGRLLAG